MFSSLRESQQMGDDAVWPGCILEKTSDVDFRVLHRVSLFDDFESTKEEIFIYTYIF